MDALLVPQQLPPQGRPQRAGNSLPSFSERRRQSAKRPQIDCLAAAREQLYREKKMIRSVIAAVALAMSAVGVQANTVVVNQVIDATVIGNATSPGFAQTPYSLSVGDTLTVNFSFLPGQALSIAGFTFIGMQASATDSTAFINTLQQNSMAFVGLQGNAHDPLGKADRTEGNALLIFFGRDEILDGNSGSLSFTGVQFSTTILSYSDGAASHEYSWVTLFASGDSVTAISAVPEPAAYLFFSVGLCALGVASRRHRGK